MAAPALEIELAGAEAEATALGKKGGG